MGQEGSGLERDERRYREGIGVAHQSTEGRTRKTKQEEFMAENEGVGRRGLEEDDIWFDTDEVLEEVESLRKDLEDDRERKIRQDM